MSEIPDEIQDRLDEYCRVQAIGIRDLLGIGFDGYVWRTTRDSVVKIHWNTAEFQRELAVYQRLASHSLTRLQGFSIPVLLNYDTPALTLELSFVSPPFVLDFAAANLGAPPAGFDPDDPAWQAEKSRLFGRDWPDVKRLLEALRLYGIHFSDVHLGNIRLRP
jgi:hypothetical protein